MDDKTMLGMIFNLELAEPAQKDALLHYGDIKCFVERVVIDYFEAIPKSVALPNVTLPACVSFYRIEREHRVHSQLIYVYYPCFTIDKGWNFTYFLNDIKKELEVIKEIIEERTFYSHKMVDVQMSFDPVPSNEMSEEVIEEARKRSLSYNNLLVKCDPFNFYLSFFDQEKFLKNILYICSAYINYNEKSTVPASFHGWKALVHSRNFDVTEETSSLTDVTRSNSPLTQLYDDDFLSSIYEKAGNFAYTIVTLHIIINDFDDSVETYYNDLIDYKLRRVFDGNVKAVYEAFSLFMRNEVFFLDEKIYWFLNGVCQPINVMRLQPRVIAFNQRIESVYRKYRRMKNRFTDCIDEETLEDVMKNLRGNFDLVKKPLFIASIIKSYLDVNLKTGVETFGVAYRDGIVMAINNVLEKRKVYMEDQMFGLGQAYIHSAKRFSWSHPLVSDIMTCFRQVFVDEENVMWFIKWLASLHAKNPERCLLNLYGAEGGNAKTTISKILSQLLGKYFMAANEALLHEDPASTCSPYSAELEGKVLICFSEVNKHRKIPSDVIKSMTGGDPKTAARKYKDPRSFEQTAKVLILSNNPLEFDGIDAALVDRIYIIECKGRYTKEAPLDPELQRQKHEYPRDESFWKREGMRDALLWIMLNSWDDYVKNGLKPTTSQMKDVSKWKKRACHVSSFISNFITFRGVSGDTSNVPAFEVKQLYDIYERYRKANNINEVVTEAAFTSALKTAVKVEEKEVLVRDPVTGTEVLSRRDVVHAYVRDFANKDTFVVSTVKLPPPPMSVNKMPSD